MTRNDLQYYDAPTRIAYAAHTGNLDLIMDVLQDLAVRSDFWSKGLIDGKRLANPTPWTRLERPDPVTIHDLPAGAPYEVELIPHGVSTLRQLKAA